MDSLAVKAVPNRPFNHLPPFAKMYSKAKYTSKLAGTTVLVIGGTSGLGFGVAEGCIENRVGHLILSSSQQTKIDSAISSLHASYLLSDTIITGGKCDLGDENTLESNIERPFGQIKGKIDHVVYTAGDALTASPLSEINFFTMKQAGMV